MVETEQEIEIPEQLVRELLENGEALAEDEVRGHTVKFKVKYDG